MEQRLLKKLIIFAAAVCAFAAMTVTAYAADRLIIGEGKFDQAAYEEAVEAERQRQEKEEAEGSIIGTGVTVSSEDFRIAPTVYAGPSEGVGSRGGTWKWDGKNELILDNYKADENFTILGDINITVIGECETGGIGAITAWYGSDGNVKTEDAGNLVFTGDGSLRINYSDDWKWYAGGSTVSAIEGNSITVEGINCEVYSECWQWGPRANPGIYAWKDVLIRDAEVTVTVSAEYPLLGSGINGCIDGIYVTIENSNVHVASVYDPEIAFEYLKDETFWKGPLIHGRCHVESVWEEGEDGHTHERITGKENGMITLNHTSVVTPNASVRNVMYEESTDERFSNNRSQIISSGTGDIQIPYIFYVPEYEGAEGYWRYDVDENALTKSGACELSTIELKATYTGWRQRDGKWYYYKDGAKLTGWQKISGKWYYMDANGVMQTAWQKISGKWYYMDASGVMQTGWQKINGSWYYFNAGGDMQRGWLSTGGKWYYLGDGTADAGYMQTGWQKINGTWYYFSSGGAMATGWQKISGIWYYFNNSGAMLTGWQTISGKTYFFKSGGAMAASEWCNGWWLNGDGSWTYQPKGSWKKSGSRWWFGDTSGWYAKSSTVTIDGKKYTFDAAGWMQ